MQTAVNVSSHNERPQSTALLRDLLQTDRQTDSEPGASGLQLL